MISSTASRFSRWIICIAILLFSHQAMAQERSSRKINPFDLVNPGESQPSIIIENEENPFNTIVPAESLLKQRIEEERYSNGYPINISRYKGDQAVPKAWMLYWTIPLILFLTLVASLFRSKLTQLFHSFTNNSALGLAYREQQGRTNIHGLFFFLLSILSFAVFGLNYVMNDYVNKENFPKAIFVALGLAGIYMGFKYLAISFVKNIFPHKKTMDFYHFVFKQHNYVLGIILIPLSIFFSFSPPEAIPFITWTAIVLIGFWWIIRILKGLQIGSKFISINVFRFFAYLCTVEIAPIIILWTIIRLVLGHEID